MTKSFLEKRDFKALTTFTLYSAITTINEDNSNERKNKIIFLTSFGYVVAESILKTEFEEKTITKENASKFVSQLTTKSRNKILIEHNNDDLLDTNTSFILENVEVRPFSGGTTILPTMILFSDAILGLFSGHLD